MNVQELTFSRFRNYEKASFSFEPACIHVFYGRNAQGKTNILESIYYLSHLRSFRTSKAASMIMHGAAQAGIKASVENKGRIERLEASIQPSKKQLSLYGAASTPAQFIGHVNAILFCPDDLSLFSNSPKDRRSFMDMELVKLSKSYTATLSKYQKLLKQRNLALKEPRVDRVLIDTFTEQMIEAQCIIIHQRRAFVRALNELAAKSLAGFAKDEKLEISYKGPVNDEQNLKQQLEELYARSFSRDLKLKSTSVGIHKDDLIFTFNDHPLIQNASQGQKRTVLLAIKLALAGMIKEKSGQYPIMLLDDVFSELDPMRKKHLVAQLPEGMQIFMTSAEPVSPSWFDRKTHFYTVNQGEIKEGLFYE